MLSRPDRRGWLAALAAGAVFGALTLPIPAVLSEHAAFALLAILLGMIANAYFGFAIQDGRRKALATELPGIVAFTAIATIALTEDSAVLLAAGYFGHGLWDLIHHPRGLELAMPWWYVPMCLSYDSVVAVYILLRFA